MKMISTPPPGLGRTGAIKPLLMTASLAIGALLVGSLVACRSLSKVSLQEKVEALPKNQAAAATGLRRLKFEADITGNVQEWELVYLHLPALQPQTKGAPIVLVHGTPGTLYTWAPLLFEHGEETALNATRDVYAVEIIGHGFAPGDASIYTFDRCARFLVAAMQALEIEPAHVVGNSYGGEFVWRAAALAPDRFASQVLMHPSGYTREDDEWLPEEEAMREMSLAKIGWRINSLKRVKKALEPHFDGIPPGRAEEMHLVLENAHNWKAMVDLARDENGLAADSLKTIQTPTLLLWGEREMAYPIEKFGRRFESDLPNADLQVMPGVGHYPQEERPDLLRKALLDAFGKIDA